MSNLSAELSQLHILTETEKQHGPKLIALYKKAIQDGADYIFQTDSDGQTDPSEFEAFWAERHNHDAILGYRKIRGDGRMRGFVEKVVCLLLKMYFGVKVPDANAPFRLMNSDLLQKYINRLQDDYNLPNIMLTTFFSYYKENIHFISVSFKARQGGKNSINLNKIFRIGWKALSDFSNFKKGMKEK